MSYYRHDERNESSPWRSFPLSSDDGWMDWSRFVYAAAPARFGNLVHNSLMLFPAVKPGDWGKNVFVRIIGIGLLAFASRFVLILICG